MPCDLHEYHPLEIKNLRVSYGSHLALDEVNIQITCHNRLALIGPNGAGKSTLIKAIAGLVKPNEGDILWRGEPLQNKQQELAYLPQIDNHQKNFPVSAKEVVEMGRYPHIGMFGEFQSKDHEEVEKAMDLMNLNELQNQQIDELSGGQQQRVFIARALAQEAHVLMLDEPFNGLDSQSRKDLADTFEILKHDGRLVIASHHNLDNVSQLFDKVLVLDTQQRDFGDAEAVMKTYRNQQQQP